MKKTPGFSWQSGQEISSWGQDFLTFWGQKLTCGFFFFDFVFFNFKLYGNTFTSVATVAYTKVSFQIS